MSLLTLLRNTFASGTTVRQAARNSLMRGSRRNTRRELVRAALRDTLTRHGIPTSWIKSELLLFKKSTGEPSIHVRLLIRQQEPQLLSYGLPFQKSFMKRVTSYDPKASSWLSGISWQFALAEGAAQGNDNSERLWTVSTGRPAAAPAAEKKERTSAGPTEQERVAELQRLFTANDAARARIAPRAGGDFQETQSFAPTQPQDR